MKISRVILTGYLPVFALVFGFQSLASRKCVALPATEIAAIFNPHNAVKSLPAAQRRPDVPPATSACGGTGYGDSGAPEYVRLATGEVELVKTDLYIPGRGMDFIGCAPIAPRTVRIR